MYTHTSEFLQTLWQLTIVGLASLFFFMFKTLVSEVISLRKEIHSLNVKIAEILSDFRMFSEKINNLERKVYHNDSHR